MPPVTCLSKGNVRCVGMIHTDVWEDPDKLNVFLRELPDRYRQYGAITLRAAPNEHDSKGALLVTVRTRKVVLSLTL